MEKLYRNKSVFEVHIKHLKHASYLVGNDGDAVVVGVVVGVAGAVDVGDVGDVVVGGHVVDYELLEQNTGLDGDCDETYTIYLFSSK